MARSKTSALRVEIWLTTLATILPLVSSACSGSRFRPANQVVTDGGAGEPRLTIALYGIGNYPDVALGPERTQPGLSHIDSLTPERTLTEHDLVDADWNERILVFNETIYDEQVSEQRTFSSTQEFVLSFDGKVLLGGGVIDGSMATWIEFPVLVVSTRKLPNAVVAHLYQDNQAQEPVSLPSLNDDVGDSIGPYLELYLASR